ncbi:MAG: lactoylglutathione lyase [Chitinophagales bacterium]|jgi:lactoylglutathione lyase
MNIVRTGIIINTEKYDECVSFYKKIFGLRILYEEKYDDFQLTCFQFESSYLMIETEGFAKPEGKTIKENPTKLRFNVANINDALKTIKSHGIEAEINKNDWGATINLFDPDGNRIGIRDEATFKSQISA